jgi:hypothetical protein
MNTVAAWRIAVLPKRRTSGGIRCSATRGW